MCIDRCIPEREVVDHKKLNRKATFKMTYKARSEKILNTSYIHTYALHNMYNIYLSLSIYTSLSLYLSLYIHIYIYMYLLCLYIYILYIKYLNI